ncbi:helix-turn-helix domain-containing protein [Aureibacter tunicatorum]|uniref:AraC-like DNA-binding protein n=1 Tax=Aureibacter tunicatorum TaxID=866807 RepID=A0AAE3XM91_9BACT|nr:helix-turn-helix transcriptional regulator [Aureibacter tunicatorum]MDR6240501.1 AraC-like DNA-binding protein [Aureibacter tunicatorum]BDD06636.1 AraC family transcriptional regulator [Aureibacter tunicatorum]
MHIEIESINQVHESLELDKPQNPLITVIDMKDYKVKKEWINQKYVNTLYSISMKDGSCGLEYGRNTYDFADGVMSFMAPGQVFSFSNKDNATGWMLLFHPELIRNTLLGDKIHQYNFFSYDVHEALHLSADEQKTVTDCMRIVENEAVSRIDKHSNSVIVSGLEFLLNFCNRFYERQFNTRSSENRDVLTKVEGLLKTYYHMDILSKSGLPTVAFLAEKINLSPGYLSDLLKSETGKTAKEHIDFYLINKAKFKLLNSASSISEIAYDLGFEYPQHFSKLFKNKTGYSPKEFRTNLN